MLEVRRKTFHILAGTLLAWFYHIGLMTQLRFLGLFVLLIFVFLVYTSIKIPVLHDLMLIVEREKDLKYFPGIGAIFFVFGMVLAVWLFPQNIATASILILAWGDSLGALIGPYGKIPYINPKKKWEGVLVAIAGSSLVAAFVVPFSSALFGATVAMLVEGLDLEIKDWKIDDNVIVPVCAGVAMVVFTALI